MKKKGLPTKQSAPKAKRGKSLGEQLAELMQPAPKEFDPEAEELGLSAPIAGADETADVDDVRLLQPASSATKSALRTAMGMSDLAELGPAYVGAVVSRKRLQQLQEATHDPLAPSDDDDGEEEDDEEEEGEDMADMEEEEAMAMEADGMGRASAGGDGDSMGSHDDDDEDDDADGGADEDEEDEDEESDERGATDVSAITQQLKELESEDASQAIFAASSRESELEKAQHVRAQQTLYESTLDFRIRVQQPLTLANRLPQCDIFAAFRDQKDDGKMGEQMASTVSCIKSLLDDLIDLQQALHSQNATLPTLPPPPSALSAQAQGGRWEGDSYWAYLQRVFAEGRAHRDDVIDKWNRKTQLTGPNKGLKVINQSVLTQIGQVMSDRDRLVERTQIRRGGARQRILGKRKAPSAPSVATNTDAQVADATGSAAAAGLSSEDDPESAPDAEIFDDTDFYQQLLREIIASGLEFAGDADRQLLAQARAARKKTRKVVDRRASKGRKIRYAVMPKLVNFMAPVPIEDESFAATELFAGLFGSNAPPMPVSASASASASAEDGAQPLSSQPLPPPPVVGEADVATLWGRSVGHARHAPSVSRNKKPKKKKS